MHVEGNRAYEFSVEIMPFNGQFVWLLVAFCDRSGRLTTAPNGKYEVKYCKTDYDGYEEWFVYPIVSHNPSVEYVTLLEKETGLKNGQFWQLVPLLCRHYS